MPGHVERDFRASGNGQGALRERKRERERKKQYSEITEPEKLMGSVW